MGFHVRAEEICWISDGISDGSRNVSTMLLLLDAGDRREEV